MEPSIAGQISLLASVIEAETKTVLALAKLGKLPELVAREQQRDKRPTYPGRAANKV